MTRASACRLSFTLLLALGVAVQSHAQCAGACQPGSEPNCSCPTRINVSFFYGGFSDSAKDAILHGLDAWTGYFTQNNVTGGFNYIGDDNNRADTMIYVDDTLRGSGAVAYGSFGAGYIRVNPDYLGDVDALAAVAAHEAGHNYCYDDVYTSGCQYATIMWGFYNPNSSGTLGPCDFANLVSDYPSQNPPPPTDPSQIPGFDTGCIECQIRGYSPILIDVSRGEYRLTGLDTPVRFDLNGDGKLDVVGWTEPGSPVAFLAWDRNGDGVINDGRELFGNATIRRDGTRAPNGFLALAEFDSNGDGIIDSADDIWSSLVLWTDVNHDGISQAYEIQAVRDSRVRAISLRYHFIGRQDAAGNFYRFQGSALLADGGLTRPIYDVWFVVAK